MSKTMVIEPDGWPCSLGECRPGLFVYEDELCLKSAYRDYYMDDGTSFVGGIIDKEQREFLLTVQPVKVVWEEE